MPQFSIIIPVYRVEEYLEKCVDSILAQTCQDFELLLIDDGSPDGVVRQGLIGQLVDGIGGVGDQLAQEDLAVCIDRIDHQVQQAFRFCLKLFLFHMDQLPYFVLALLVPEC